MESAAQPEPQLAKCSEQPLTAHAETGDIEPGQTMDSALNRFDWLDVLRALAIADIVGLHTVDWEPFFGMGLPVFVICTIALTTRRTPPHPWRVSLRRRASRLLLPWLFWSAFYGIVNTFRAFRSGKERFGDLTDPQIEMLWLGTEIILWYLPFAFVAEVVINTFAHGIDRYQIRFPKFMAGLWLVLGVALPTALPILFGDHALPPIMSTWMKGALLLPLGVGVGLMLRNYKGRWPTVLTVMACGFIMLGLHAIARSWAGMAGDGVLASWQWETGLGAVLIGLAVGLPAKAPKWMAWTAAFTFPIYLIHNFVAWPVDRLVHYTIGEVNHWQFWILAWAAALAVAVLMKRTPIVRNYC